MCITFPITTRRACPASSWAGGRLSGVTEIQNGLPFWIVDGGGGSIYGGVGGSRAAARRSNQLQPREKLQVGHSDCYVRQHYVSRRFDQIEYLSAMQPGRGHLFVLQYLHCDPKSRFGPLTSSRKLPVLHRRNSNSRGLATVPCGEIPAFFPVLIPALLCRRWNAATGTPAIGIDLWDRDNSTSDMSVHQDHEDGGSTARCSSARMLQRLEPLAI